MFAQLEKGNVYMKISKAVMLAAAAAMLLSSLSGCYFLPEEEEVYDAPVVKESEVSYTTTTATKKDIVKDIKTAGTIASGTEYNARFTEYGGNIKGVYVAAGDSVNEGDLIAEIETYELDKEIELKELEVYREELEYEIAVEKHESETVKAKEQLDIQLMQNELDKLYAEKEASKIYAGVSGTVSFVKTLSPGDWINAGETVVTIIDITDLYIKINPNNEASEFLIGRPIKIRYEGEYYDGEITRNKSGKLWDEATSAAKVDEAGEFVLGEESEDIIVAFKGSVPASSAVGNIADTVLVLDERHDVIVISANLIKKVNGQDVVYLFKDNERVQTPVVQGLRSGSSVEITSGLEVGDEIIIR